MLIQSFTWPMELMHVPRRLKTAVSSAMATSKSSGAAGGLVTSSEKGRKEYLSSIPSSFQTFTCLPSWRRQSAIASSQPSASPSGRTWLITTKRSCFRRGSAISPRLQLFFIGQIDFVEDFHHTRSAFNGFVELEMKLRSVFQNDAVREFLLKFNAMFLKP